MYIVTYLCLAAISFVHSVKIHKLMTPDEVMGIFHTTHDAVPDYQLVRVLYSMDTMYHDGTAKVYVNAFTKNISLHLSSNEGYLASEDTPVWLVKSDEQAPEGLQYTLIPQALRSIGIPMQDEKAESALLVQARNNELPLFDGILSSDIVIRSLPDRIIKDVLYQKHGLFQPRFPENIMEGNLTSTYHHIVYKKIPPQGYENFSITNPPVRMYPIPDVIYPELLVIVDYSLYSMLGRNLDQAKQYIVAFWNGVDLRYRVLTNPKVRLNIAGIIIAMDEGAIPYINKSRLDSNLVNADRALRGMGDYFYRETRFPWKFYDIAMATTHLDLCNMIDENSDICDPATLGYAYVAGACNRNSTTKSSEAVGLAEDNGGFNGIIAVTHELGHLIGARHDGNPKNPGNCSSRDGFIMSGTLRLSKNEFEWSNCSISAFHKFLGGNSAKCLYDEPPKANAIRRILPGKLMSVDQQCEQYYGAGACNKNTSSICYELKCKVPDDGNLCVIEAAAAEGSSCGRNLICLDGKCVLEGTETKDERSYV